MKECMLTTVDNPFDPFENFEEWYKIDMLFGYNTCGLLARIAPQANDALPDQFNEDIKERCIDRWCKMFPLTYKKVTRVVADPDYSKYTDESYDEYYEDSDEAEEVSE